MPPKARGRPKKGSGEQLEAQQTQSAPLPEAQKDDNIEMQDVDTSEEPSTTTEPQTTDPLPSDNPSLPPATTAKPPSAQRRRGQRLASVLARSSSNTPSLLNPDGEPSHVPMKFKPKSAARKSKEEREAAEKADAERLAARKAADASANESGTGAGYGMGRGRGGFGEMSRGRGAGFPMSHGATGHLGGSTIGESSGRKKRGGFGSGGGGGGGGGRGGEGGGRGGGRGRGGHSGTSVKGEKDKDGDVIMGSSTNKSKTRKTKIKKEDQAPTYVSSDDEYDSEGRQLLDIENINLVTDEEPSGAEDHPVSDVTRGEKRQRTTGPRRDLLRPVRIDRQEHVERAVGVNTDASSLTSAELRRRAKERNEAGGSLFLDEEAEAEIVHTLPAKGRRKAKDVEFVKNERIWKGVYQDEDDSDTKVKIKDEPKDEGEIMLVDKPLEQEGPERMAVDEDEGIPLSGAIQNTLPDVSGAVPQQLPDIDQTALDIADIEESTQGHLKARRFYDTLFPQTPDEIEEHESKYSAENDEIFFLLAETEPAPLSPTTKPTPALKTEKSEDATSLAHEANALVPVAEKENYTIQLPPLLPSLRDIAKKPTAPKDKESPKSKDPPNPDPNANAKGKAKSTAPTSSNPFATGVKPDPNPNPTTDIKPPLDLLTPTAPIPHTYASPLPHLPSGLIGHLRIHKGGNMSAAWGGLDMKVRRVGEGRGAEGEDELVVTKEEVWGEGVKREEEGGLNGGGRGWGVGKMGRGFVGVPVLGGLLS